MAKFIEVTTSDNRKLLLSTDVIEHIIDGREEATIYFMKDRSNLVYMGIKEKYTDIKKALGL